MAALPPAMARVTLAIGVDKKDRSLTIRLAESTKRELQVHAGKRARSASWLAVDIIERWLKARRRRPK